MKKAKLTFIDLFSGAGGFSVGFGKEDFQNIFSIDCDNSFCKTYKRNFPDHYLIEGRIQDLKKRDIKKIIKNNKVDVVIGGPPCQGFSIAGNIGRKFLNDPRNYLFKEFVRVVDIVKPTFFVMENVARLYTHNGGKTREEIISSFENIGYKVECEILNSVDYEVPQIRRRVVFIGTNNKNGDIIFPKNKTIRYITVREALSRLPKLKSGQSDNAVPNHVAMNHTNQMLKKMFYVKNGGDRKDIPTSIRPRTGDPRKYIRY